MRNQVAFGLFVEELDWNVVVQIDDAAIFKTEVEVHLISTTVARENQVLWELALLVARLEETVLAVQLHVPCDQVDDVVDIVDQVELEQAINTCLVHAVQPDVLSKVDVEIFWSVWLRNTGILNGGSTFDNDEFTKLPCLVHLGISLCQP